MQLARGLLRVGDFARGPSVRRRGNGSSTAPRARSGVGLANDGYEIEARSVVLATGYVMPDIVQSTRSNGIVELGDRDRAAAAEYLEGRRADLGE